MFNLTIGLFWLISAIIDYSQFCYIWQLKEYRTDRMRDFFKTLEGKKYWLSYNILFNPIIALAMFLWPINDVPTVKYIILAITILDILRAFILIFQHRFRRPVITPKAMLIIFTCVFFEGMAAIFSLDWTTFFFFLMIRFFIISLTTILFNKPTLLIKKIIIDAAKKKIKGYPNMVVIGITGSYGKTTVKEFLTKILSAKYKVVSTPKHTNTDIGVSQFILKTDFDNCEIFVVEMGAYREGEIKAITEIVHPKIGILTAINEQHLSLFGSIQKTQQAKYELLRSLPLTGLAIINADNKYCMEFVDTLASKVQTFGADQNNKNTLIIENEEQTKEGIRCLLKFTDTSSNIQIEAPINGVHNCFNLAPCLLVARHLGMTNDQIKNEVKNLHRNSASLQTFKYGNTILIDDTYNSNPTGFKSALYYMASFPSDMRRIVVTRGMYELGEKSEELHERVGEEISFMADELIITNKDFETPLRRGLVEKYRVSVYLKDTPESLLEYFKSIKESKSVVLLENRIPELVRKELFPAK
jgi:UDP-N-acetylmuramoyl-tripeptide--D-alanyl-D-alanine ligase